jgi:hypothetical protein
VSDPRLITEGPSLFVGDSIFCCPRAAGLGAVFFFMSWILGLDAQAAELSESRQLPPAERIETH